MDVGRGEERVRCMERVTQKCALQPTRICCMTQETRTRALYQARGGMSGGRWEGGSKGRGYMYHVDVYQKKNSVKQLSFN